jgi:DNA-binding MarR family transcriptional regulator
LHREVAESVPLHFLSPIHKASRQISLDFEPKMAALGVGNPEGHLLSFLRTYSPSTVGEVRRVFGRSGSTLTGILDRLEERGLITRELHPEDRRSFLVHITRKGRRVADKVQQFVEQFEIDVHAQITRADLQGFQRVMAAIGEVTQVEVRESRRATKQSQPATAPPRRKR